MKSQEEKVPALTKPNLLFWSRGQNAETQDYDPLPYNNFYLHWRAVIHDTFTTQCDVPKIGNEKCDISKSQWLPSQDKTIHIHARSVSDYLGVMHLLCNVRSHGGKKRSTELGLIRSLIPLSVMQTHLFSSFPHVSLFSVSSLQ